MKFLTLGSALFLAATATSVLAQANNRYITKPCVFNTWTHCERGYTQILEEGHCYCRRPLNDVEVAARRDELCKTYTDQCLTYGKNFDILQSNGIYCLAMGTHCPKAVWDAFCAEAKAKGYKFQCPTQAEEQPDRAHSNFEDLEYEEHEFPDGITGKDFTINLPLHIPDYGIP